jgi:hypothetical protein
LLLAVAGCGTPAKPAAPIKQSPPMSLEERWGIQIASLRMSAAGRIVDFRYRVLDPEKAALLGDRNVKPVLIDQATNRKLAVPVAPKIGSLRQTSVKLAAGRIYFVLFSNSEQVIRSGSKVTVAIGDFRAENLTVE